MLFDLRRKMLMTSSGVDIKKIECPIRMSWNQLVHDHEQGPYCSTCDRAIVDTSLLSEEEILAQVGANPACCLAIPMDRVIVFGEDINQ